MISRTLKNFFKKRWPITLFDEKDVPHFIFLLTPPNSGSTAIAKVFQSSDHVTSLLKNGEGQWLMKGMYAKDRWSPAKEISAQSIKSVWLSAYQALKVQRPALDVVLEKSPPNLVRIEALQEIFPDHTLLANNRNPYANCSSIFYRYTPKRQIAGMDAEQRDAAMQEIAQEWVERSETLKDTIEKQGVTLITYEQFCEDPTVLQTFISGNERLKSIELNSEQEITVKDYKSQGIQNFNAKQIANLSTEDKSSINKVLRNKVALLAFFGYKLAEV